MVVPLQESHINQCVEIMLNNALWQHYGVTQANAQLQFLEGLTSSDAQIVVAVDTHTVTGFIWYYLHGTFHSGGYIRLIGVHPNFHNKGIGGHLMAFAETTIAEQSKHIFLLSSDFNQAAHRFYERLGYRAVGSLPDFAREGISEVIFMKNLHEKEAVKNQ